MGRRPRTRWCATAVTAATCLVCLAAPAAAAREPRLAYYTGSASTGFTLESATADGRDPLRLGAGFGEAAWSPDGSRLAYWRDGSSSDAREVVVVQADGRELWRWDVPATGLVWAPAGDRLAVASTAGLFVVGSDGSGRTKVAEATQTPSWAPDGRRLAYGSPQGLFTIGVDNRDRQRLSHRAAGAPRWSPDGSRIAFPHTTAATPGVTSELYLVAADGQGAQVRVATPASTWVDDLRWHPSGARLLFVEHPSTDTGDPGTVADVAAAGGPRRVLARGDRAFGYSPDGTALAFSSGTRLMLASQDGSDQRPVELATPHRFFGTADWSSDGERLAVHAYEPQPGGGVEEQAIVVRLDDDAPHVLADPGRIVGFQPRWRRPASARDTDRACPDGQVPEDGFADAEGTTHEPAIDCAAWWELTRGTGTGTYTPRGSVTRGQAASLIAALVTRSGGALPSRPADAFDDDGSSRHEHAIDQLAAVGILAGVDARRFEPGGRLTRAQLASAISRTYAHLTDATLPDAGTDHFRDDDRSPHERSVDAAALAGIVAGVDGRYAPTDAVTRGQAAAILTRLLDVLVVEGRTSAPTDAR